MLHFLSFLVLVLSVSQVLVTTSDFLSGRRGYYQSLLQRGNVSSGCPLNFAFLRRMAPDFKRPNLDTDSKCQYIRQGLRLALANHLRLTDSFLPLLDSAESCWNAYQSRVRKYVPEFDIRRRCGFETPWIARGCMNINTRSEFEAAVPRSALNRVTAVCNKSLLNNSRCASCTTALAGIQPSYLLGPSVGNVSDCTAYPLIYAAAFANQFGPTDVGTAKCLFNLDFTQSNSSRRRKKIVISVVVVVACVVILILGFFRRRREMLLMPESANTGTETNMSIQVHSDSDSTAVIRFSLDEIKAATQNFARDHIIGRGRYGHVYKGILPDNSEVAVKRLKNCSASGDASFVHEVEAIARVRHENLVALRGYCTATSPSIPLEDRQMIIVCDLMKNGSVDDHLFGSREEKLSWPIRQRIALGTARGLAYLHQGADPAIVHRDIKASNVLLDDDFEPKVADFGMAEIRPEGLTTQTSTRIEGTIGYVAPEYLLYGHLTERIDVYSFGMVLLELLSGKKALLAVNAGKLTLVSDWAWSLVKKGRAMDVVDEDMPELGPPEVVEKYVLVAVLCSHPQLFARPKMDQVVKMLDGEVPIPSIPERPISVIANVDDPDSGNLSSPPGYQHDDIEEDHQEEGE